MLYRLIIADDEKFILDGLTTCVDWNKLGFEIIATCSDGEQVIDYLDSVPVDTVLTDIRMGYVTGIDIAKYVKESCLPCKVVFISAYKEFEYALQGMQYGVTDYILKPSKVSDLEQTFRKVKQCLDEQNQDAQQREEFDNRWKEIRPVLEETLFSNLIMGAIKDKKSIEQRMRIIFPEIDTVSCPCFLSCLEIENYHDFLTAQTKYNAAQFNEAVYEFIHAFDRDFVYNFIYKTGGRIKLFSINKKSGVSKQSDILSFQKSLNHFRTEFESTFDVRTSVKIEHYFPNIYSIVDDYNSGKSYQLDNSELETHIREQKKLVVANILQGNIGTARRIVQNMVLRLDQQTIRYRNHCLVDLWSNIIDCLRENNIAAYNSISPYINYLNILNLNSEASILLYCDRIFDKMHESIHMSGNYSKEGLLVQIKEYIQDHIFEDIQIDDLASAFYISAPHLRRIIKQQTGNTFLQYTSNIKMAKAAEMLSQPEYRIYEIGEKLGYKTARYFSKLFYSYSGFYPSQYRREVLGIGGNDEDERLQQS